MHIPSEVCKRILVLGLFLLSSILLRADVEALNQIIKPGQSWTVPTGKAVILTHAVRTGGSTTGLFAHVHVPGADANEFMILTCFGSVTSTASAIPAPFKAGTRFENPGSNPSSIIIIGKLADEADLFACVPVELEGIAATSSSIASTAKVSSPRPVQVVVEATNDLKANDWEAVDDAAISKIDVTQHSVIIPVSESEQTKFVRAKARVVSK